MPSNTMIRTHSVAVLLAGLLVLSATRVCWAQDPDLQSIPSQFALIEEALSADGFGLQSPSVTRSALQGASDRLSLELAEGVAYQIIGACDNDCSDLDLVLYDPSGDPIGEDRLDDDIPILELVATTDGVFTVEVVMVSCSVEPCAWGVQLYAAHEPVQPDEDREAQARPTGASHFKGTLTPGDARLSDGSFYDTYGVDVREGQSLTVEMTSDRFDTYLLVRSPSGREQENDDHLGSTGQSHLRIDRPEAGSWTIVATSYDPGVEGSYTVDVTLGDRQAHSSTGVDGWTEGVRHEVGALESGDPTLPGGEYVDEFTFAGHAGEEVVIDLRSSEFDPYLIMRGPDGLQEDNDDYEGATDRSLLRLPLPSSGEYTVGVTSYTAEETGAYELTIRTALANAGASPVTHRGTLGSGDQTLSSGEYVDEYTFEAAPGEAVRIDLSSDDFDTYVMLLGPEDFRRENDDADEGVGHSRVEAELTESGTHRVLVTSYRPDEAGTYELRIQRLATRAGTEQRQLQTIEPGRTASGVLEDGDARLESGEFRDLWAFEGRAGQQVRLEVTSDDFDTYLMLLSPDGDVLDENDDIDGRTDLSRIEARLPQSGRYRVVATSYAQGEAGAYALTLHSAAEDAVTTSQSGHTDSADGRLFGVFVGVSDYGGRANDLAYTAEDAHRAAEAMMTGGGMSRDNAIVLTDSDATVDNVRDAFAQMGQRVGPNDTFIYFYSGHGARVARSDPERSDPDALDETIELYDGTIRDNEMSDLLALVDADLSLVVLDACFSGGFSKDVISAPGRMGLFSSEEDVTSQVAAKFRAGGYLAQFVFDGVGERLADADGDGGISAIELSQYIHERYRFDVKSAAPGDYVRTGGPQTGFQHFVVDRGSIAPDRVIFR